MKERGAEIITTLIELIMCDDAIQQDVVSVATDLLKLINWMIMMISMWEKNIRDSLK